MKQENRKKNNFWSVITFFNPVQIIGFNAKTVGQRTRNKELKVVKNNWVNSWFSLGLWFKVAVSSDRWILDTICHMYSNTRWQLKLMENRKNTIWQFNICMFSVHFHTMLISIKKKRMPKNGNFSSTCLKLIKQAKISTPTISTNMNTKAALIFEAFRCEQTMTSAWITMKTFKRSAVNNIVMYDEFYNEQHETKEERRKTTQSH